MRFLVPLFILHCLPAFATDYHVGPSQALSAIADVPWSTLQAGDKVYIHWKSTAYNEKWVINREGTAANRIEVIGISGPSGQKPIINGNGATTPTVLSYWNENRGVIKIGGSSVPSDGIPSYITIENLEIRSGRPPYSFTDDNGNAGSYVNNAAAIYIEKGQHIIIRNCTLRDCGNGIFIGAYDGDTQEILIEKNHIYDNGNSSSIYEHNTYTAGINITYQYNHFGPLRSGAGGNNLKDRSAGLVVRYNWIESGNRQLDLVDAEDSQVLVNHPAYPTTHVYGNILIEPDGAGNSQMVHYGGDSGTEADYRKGDLYFYNNTVISTRTGNTTLMRLSTNDETAHVFNNVIYTAAAGNKFAMIGGNGTFNMHHNWLKTGWKSCHCAPSGSVVDQGNNLVGSDPLFSDFPGQDFTVTMGSASINQGAAIPSNLLPSHDVASMYEKHTGSQIRNVLNQMDMGAFEFVGSLCTGTTEFMNGSWSNGTPDPTKMAVLKSNYNTTTYGSIDACACTVEATCLLTITSGMQLQVDEELIIEGLLDAQQGSTIQVQSE